MEYQDLAIIWACKAAEATAVVNSLGSANRIVMVTTCLHLIQITEWLHSEHYPDYYYELSPCMRKNWRRRYRWK